MLIAILYKKHGSCVYKPLVMINDYHTTSHSYHDLRRQFKLYIKTFFFSLEVNIELSGVLDESFLSVGSEVDIYNSEEQTDKPDSMKTSLQTGDNTSVVNQQSELEGSDTEGMEIKLDINNDIDAKHGCSKWICEFCAESYKRKKFLETHIEPAMSDENFADPLQTGFI